MLDVLGRAERASEHKCASTGSIEIAREDGAVECLSILPGHNSEFYEYRYRGRINRVDRRPFIQALKAMGLDES